MSASIHKVLGSVRKPRVHISLDIETEGAEGLNELPFIIGVMGDFSGDPTAPLKSLSDRKFARIDRDNFDEVMATMNSGLDLKVENTLAGDKTEMAVHLRFDKMEDFDPVQVARQVPALRALLETREKLRELMSKADRSENLEALLEQVLQNQGELTQVSGQLGLNPKEG